MKRILLITSILFTSLLSAQSFEKVHETNVLKKQQYLNFINWSSKNQVFIRNKEVVTKDEESGTVITNLDAFSSKEYLEYRVKLTLKADFRDNKYRLSCSDPIIVISPENVDLQSLGVASLDKVIKRLEMVETIAKQINGMAEWQYNDVVKLRDSKQNRLNELNSNLATLSDKKEIRRTNNSIVSVKNQLDYLNEIIGNIDALVNILYEDIEKTVDVNDDF